MKWRWDTSLQLSDYQMFKWDVLKQALQYTAGRINRDRLSVKWFGHVHQEALKSTPLDSSDSTSGNPP